jgi:hypothetical protein
MDMLKISLTKIQPGVAVVRWILSFSFWDEKSEPRFISSKNHADFEIHSKNMTFNLITLYYG